MTICARASAPNEGSVKYSTCIYGGTFLPEAPGTDAGRCMVEGDVEGVALAA